MNIKQFKKEFAIIKEYGYYKSIRKGNGGVGHTLEQLLGLKENNISAPDLGKIELKAHRDYSKVPITLFTFDSWAIHPDEAIKRFGKQDRVHNYKSLHSQVTLTPNSHGLFLHITKKNVDMLHYKHGTLIASWSIEDIEERFEQKFPSMIFVKAACEPHRGEVHGEHFWYYEAQLFRKPSIKTIAQQLKAGNMVIETRIHEREGRAARNHGTAFRANEDKLGQFFEMVDLIN